MGGQGGRHSNVYGRLSEGVEEPTPIGCRGGRGGRVGTRLRCRTPRAQPGRREMEEDARRLPGCLEVREDGADEEWGKEGGGSPRRPRASCRWAEKA